MSKIIFENYNLNDQTTIVNSIRNTNLKQTVFNTIRKLKQKLYLYECKQTLIGHTKSVTCILQLKDGPLLSTSHDNTIRIWKLSDNFKPSSPLMEFTSPIETAIQLKNKNIAIGLMDGRIIILKYPGMCFIKELNTKSKCVRKLVELNDRRLISCSRGSVVKIWDLSDGDDRDLDCCSLNICTIEQLRDGRLVAGTEDSVIVIFKDGDILKKAKKLKGHKEAIHALLETSNGELISCSRDRSIRLWDVEKYKCVRVIGIHCDWVTSIIELDDGKIASGSYDFSVAIWDKRKVNSIYSVRNFIGHKYYVNCVLQLRDKRIVSCSLDGTIRLWC
jgi:WD40 repeat protein